MKEALKKNSYQVVVLSLYFFVTFLLIKLSDIFQVSEAREGSVVKAILADNTWALPLRSSFAIPSKPPLFHWIGAIFGTIFGEYDELLLRLPSLLAAIGTLIVVSIYAKKIAGNLAGIFAPAILCTMYGFSRLALDGRVDMFFCFFVTAATLIGLKSVNEKINSKERISIALLSGFAILTKGPTGLIIPILVIFTSRVALKGFSSWKEIISWELILAPVIALSWYITAYIKLGGSFLQRQIVFENISRFFGGEGINEKGSFFYLPHLLGQGAPWSVLFFMYIFFLGRNYFRRGKKQIDKNRFLPEDKKISQAIVNSLIWFGVLITALSLSYGKRRAYLLLCLPSVSLVLAFRFSSALEQINYLTTLPNLIKKHRYRLWTWGVLIFLLASLPGIALFGISNPESLEIISPKLSAFLTNLVSVSIRGGALLVFLFAFLGVGSLFFWIYGVVKEKPKYLGLALFLFLILTTTFYTQCWLSYKSLTHSYKRIGLRLATLIPPEIKLNLIKTPADESFDVLLFYYGKGVNLVEPTKIPEKPGLYLTKKSWVNANPSPRLKRILVDKRTVDKAGMEVELVSVE